MIQEAYLSFSCKINIALLALYTVDFIGLFLTTCFFLTIQEL
jgi:hypothetical protein